MYLDSVLHLSEQRLKDQSLRNQILICSKRCLPLPILVQFDVIHPMDDLQGADHHFQLHLTMSSKEEEKEQDKNMISDPFFSHKPWD